MADTDNNGARGTNTLTTKSLELVDVIDLAYLLRGRKEVQLCHAGEIYRLRLTKNGKLILNK